MSLVADPVQEIESLAASAAQEMFFGATEEVLPPSVQSVQTFVVPKGLYEAMYRRVVPEPDVVDVAKRRVLRAALVRAAEHLEAHPELWCQGRMYMHPAGDRNQPSFTHEAARSSVLGVRACAMGRVMLELFAGGCREPEFEFTAALNGNEGLRVMSLNDAVGRQPAAMALREWAASLA